MTSEPAAGPPKDLPRVIGGYRVLRELGRSELGPVLLARHRPTGRDVALIVLKPEWACLPVYVARVARDAFVASHIRHPNLARLEDLGESQGRVYFASEFVDGEDLAERVRRQGPMPPREAIAAVIQAARGLQALHGEGLTHGDVRPERFVVDRDGNTKLTGVGLTTTPATMAGEIARESTTPIPVGDEAKAEADAEPFRADLKGLGRTLVSLVTGRPSAGLPDSAELVALGVPAHLIETVRKLIDPTHGRGFADAGQVIATLERLLEGRKPGSNAPGEEHTRILSESLKAFRASPSAVLRSRVLSGSAAACVVLVALSLLGGRFILAACLAGLGLLTALARFVTASLTRGTELYPRVRGLVVESQTSDWLTGTAAAAVLIAALVAFQLHWAWLWIAVFATFLAVAMHLTLDRQAESERRGSVEEARELIKRLRLQGVSEAVLRRLVRTTAGPDWEEFYQTLFGEEARRAARDPSELGLRAQFGKRQGRLVDVLTPLVEDRRFTLQRERLRAFFQAVEERNLTAQGVNLLTARRKARRLAEALVAVSSELRSAARRGPGNEGGAHPEHQTVTAALRHAAEAPEDALIDREEGLIGTAPSLVMEIVTGPRTRFILGAILLAGCLLWVHQNEIVTGSQVEQIREAAAKAIESSDHLGALRDAKIDVRIPEKSRPLRLPFVPQPVLRLFQGFNPGVAGLLLILSAFAGGSRVGFFAIPGAAITLVGPSLGFPGFGPVDAQVASLVVGVGVALAGLAFGRGTR